MWTMLQVNLKLLIFYVRNYLFSAMVLIVSVIRTKNFQFKWCKKPWRCNEKFSFVHILYILNIYMHNGWRKNQNLLTIKLVFLRPIWTQNVIKSFWLLDIILLLILKRNCSSLKFKHCKLFIFPLRSLWYSNSVNHCSEF